MSFELGAVVPLSVTITASDGTPANAGAVTVTVTLPDGTTTTSGTVTPASTGVYNYDFPTTKVGIHQVRWIATGLNASAFTDTFTVDAATGGDFISLAEVKLHLNKAVAKTNDDAELAGFIASACQMIEDRIGAVAPRAATQTVWQHHHHAYRRQFILDVHPVVGVTTVTVDGVTVPQADPVTGTDGWVLDPGPGVLAHTRRWPWGRVEVSYRAGRTPLPGNIRLAALELAAHLWKSSQLNSSGGRPNPAGMDDLALRGVGFALPYRVRELLGLGKLPTGDVQVG